MNDNAEKLFLTPIEALKVIADGKGKCSVCGVMAEGEGSGCITCDCRGYWVPIDPMQLAAATLAFISENKVTEKVTKTSLWDRTINAICECFDCRPSEASKMLSENYPFIGGNRSPSNTKAKTPPPPKE